MPGSDAFPVAFVLDEDDYAVMTAALTEYADEMLFRANEGGPNASLFLDNAGRARRLTETVEKALDES